MKVTIKDIAKITGVSPATVSKVINNYSDVGEETKRKIIEAMDKAGYRPSENKAKKLRQIAVIFAGKIKSDLNHPFFGQVMNTFQKEMGFLDYDLLFLSNEKEEQENFLERCRNAQVEGCMIVGGDEIQERIYELDQSEIPCIGIDIQLSGNRSGYLMTDNYKLAKAVVEHLYLLGHREIAYLGGTLSSFVGQERDRGFIQAMNEFGLTIREEWYKHGDFKIQSGYNVMKSYLQLEQLPKAVFAVSDLMAFGAIAAIKEQGLKIPDDIAVIGCDDIEPTKYIDPPLTTIKQDTVKIGKLAARMLVDIIQGVMESSSVVVDPELIVRESCGSKTTSSPRSDYTQMIVK